MTVKVCNTLKFVAMVGALCWVSLDSVIAQTRALDTGQGSYTAGVNNTPAHQQFVFAYRLLQRGESEMAAEAFEQYLERFPGDEKRGDGLYYRALLAHRAGDPAAALRWLDDPLLSEPVSPTKVVPGYAVSVLKGQVYIDLERYDRAVEVLEPVRVDRLSPMVRTSVVYMKGIAYRGLGNLDAARSHLQRVCETDTPMRQRAWVDLARVQALSGDNDTAIESLKTAISLGNNPVRADAARLAGDLSYNAGRYTQAIQYYRMVVTQHQSSPHFATAVMGVMWSQLQAGLYEELLNSFERDNGLLGTEDRVAIWYLAGSAHQELGQHIKALGLFHAIRIGATDSPIQDKVLYKQAVSHFELGQYEEMTRSLDKLQRLFPKSTLNIDREFLLAAMHAKQDDPDGGIERLTKIIDSGPDHPYYGQALLQRGKLYEMVDRYEAATDDYRGYVDLPSDGTNPRPRKARQHALIRLIDLNYAMQRYEAAIEAGELLLAGDGIDNPQVVQEGLFRVSLARIKLRDFTEALTDLGTLLGEHPRTVYRSEALYYRGLIHMSLDRPQEALVDLQAAADSVGLEDTLKTNALRLIAMHLRRSDQTGLGVKALSDLEAHVGLSGLRAEEQLWMGQRCLDRGDYSGGLPYFQAVILAQQGVMPDQRGEALYHAGRCHRALGQTDAALGAFQHIIAIGSDLELQARLEMGKTLGHVDRLEEALDVYDGLTVSERSSIAAEALYDSAVILLRMGRIESQSHNGPGAEQTRHRARQQLKRVVLLYATPQMSPIPQRSYLELGQLEQQSGRPDVAIATYEELIERFPDDPHADYARAKVALLQNRIGDAQFVLERLRTRSIDDVLADRVEGQLKVLEHTR